MTGKQADLFEQSGYSKEECAAMLPRMRDASNAFYVMAFRIGCHPFIEFAGLMNEYIKACEEALAKGVPFPACSIHTGMPLPLAGHHLEYIEEKLACIYTGRVIITGQADG